MTVINVISYSKAKSELEQSAINGTNAQGELREGQITAYFEGQQRTVQDLASNPQIISALKRMGKSFYNIESDLKRDADRVSASLESYYGGPFAKAYAEKSGGGKADPMGLYRKLDNPARWSQYLMISENPSPLGSKHDMVTPAYATSYSRDHEELHPYLRKELELYGFYDIFLVTPDAGRVIYTVFKELDYGTSLTKGAYADSGLGRAFQSAKKLKVGEVRLEDYALYTPSYDAPAAFMSSPVYEGSTLLGVLIVQIPLDRVTSVLAERVGLAEKGEAYMVGLADGLLRTDSFRNKATHTVVNAFRDAQKYAIKTEAIQHAREHGHYAGKNVSYDGLEVVGAYHPVKVGGSEWLVVVEVPEDEIFAPVKALGSLLATILAISTIAIGVLGWFIASGMSRRFVSLAQGLGKNSDELAHASTRIASTSTELSEASTEQAASLQETVASVEEISAMVNQNAEAATKSREASANSRREAEEGRKTVAEMIDAIGQIKSSNEEILKQMTDGNREIADIVKVIGEIGEKTKVINDIVFQTKLLSFNASVEAARAGEHGKGFAVVAEEVGNLAQMSGDAAKEISEMLTGSMQKVEGIVEKTTQKVDRLVELGRDKVALGQSTAQKCRDSLDRILTQVGSVADMVTEISNASREQAQGIQEITKAVNQLDQVTQQNTMASQESSSQAEALSSQAVELNALVEQLLVYVEGRQQARGAQMSAGPSEGVKNVVSLAKKKKEKAQQAAPAPRARASGMVEKKVVGMKDPEVPTSDDPRFEDF
jgi:methyl-accepting chemotaxis protein